MRNLWDSETANQQRTRGWSYNVCRYFCGVFNIYFIDVLHISPVCHVCFFKCTVHPHYLNRRKKQVRLPRFSQEASHPRRSLTKEEFLMEQILHQLIGGKHPIILHWVSSKVQDSSTGFLKFHGFFQLLISGTVCPKLPCSCSVAGKISQHRDCVVKTNMELEKMSCCFGWHLWFSVGTALVWVPSYTSRVLMSQQKLVKYDPGNSGLVLGFLISGVPWHGSCSNPKLGSPPSLL